MKFHAEVLCLWFPIRKLLQTVERSEIGELETSVNPLSELCVVFTCIAVTGFLQGNLAGELFFCLYFALELLVKVLRDIIGVDAWTDSLWEIQEGEEIVFRLMAGGNLRVFAFPFSTKSVSFASASDRSFAL